MSISFRAESWLWSLMQPAPEGATTQDAGTEAGETAGAPSGASVPRPGEPWRNLHDLSGVSLQGEHVPASSWLHPAAATSEAPAAASQAWVAHEAPHALSAAPALGGTGLQAVPDLPGAWASAVQLGTSVQALGAHLAESEPAITAAVTAGASWLTAAAFAGPVTAAPMASLAGASLADATFAKVAVAPVTAAVAQAPAQAAPAIAAPAAPAPAAAAAIPNDIIAENLNHRTAAAVWTSLGMSVGGSPEDVWNAAASNQIEGFAADISYDIGQTVQFKINVNGTAAQTLPYRIEIFRLGYYGGDGATLVATINNADGTVQPNPIKDTARNLVDAGNWSVTDSWAMPTTAVSGVYVARLDRLDASGHVIAGASNQIPFIVRDDTPADGTKSDIVLQTSDTTWQAYNGWGGNNSQAGANLYGGGIGGARAYAVSYNRPFLTREGVGTGSGPQDYLFGADYAAIYWLEKNGYDVSYISGVDSDRLGASALIGHKAFISVGHDEYWSGNQRSNVEAARDAGTSLLFWSGNDVYWKTRFEASISGGAVSYRTLVCYKETATNTDPNAPASSYSNLDPSNDWTGTWRDLRFATATDANGNLIATGARPENSLTGQSFLGNGEGQFGAALDIPQDYAGLRVWRGTAVQTSAGTFDIAPGLIGYEWDASPVDASRPAGLVKLSETVIPWGAMLQDQGNSYGPGTGTHNLTLYRAPSGALVFGTGTTFWSWALSDRHEQYAPYSQTAYIENAVIKQMQVNILADMGIQPGSLEAGLIAATKSTDVTPATVTMANLPNSVSINTPTTITGTAADPVVAGTDLGKVALVEVSVDGGVTWRPAQGTTSWSYTWTPTAGGTYQVMARAIDDSLNLPTAGGMASDTVTVAPGTVPSAVSLFGAAEAPDLFVLDAWDPTDYELGMRFTASMDGSVTELKYYRGAVDADNTDIRTLHLWLGSNTTTPLATATITSAPGATGWQIATLATPISITAGTSYVVSYGTTENYAKTDAYFATTHTDASGLLTGPASSASNGNGVYAVGPGLFPQFSGGGANYWADVTFAPKTAGTSTPVSVFATGEAPDLFVLDAWDPTDYELGMRFTVSKAGTISQLKYYRGTVDADNTDIRTLHLWLGTNTTTPLATATITSAPGASGWQVATLATPIHIDAGTAYVVSYGTTENYAKSDTYFATAHSDASGTITGLATGAIGNGVYAVGPGAFPGLSGGGANYWADVTFTADGTVAAAPSITSNGGGATASVSRAENGTSVTTVTVQKVAATDTISYALSGTDAAKFAINAGTGVLTFVAAPNFDAAGDVGANNVYDLVVTATDQLGRSGSQAIAVAVTNLDEAPTGSIKVAGYQGMTTTGVTLVASDTLGVDPDQVVTGSRHLVWQALSGTTWSNVGPADSTTYAINNAAGTYRVAETYTDAFGAKTIASAAMVQVGTGVAETITGSAAADLLLGLAGNDTFTWSAGADVIDGGAGTDTVSFAGTTLGVSVNLASAVAVPGLSPAVSGNAVTGTDLGATQYLVGIERVVGGAGNDTFIGWASGGYDGGAGTLDTLQIAATSAALNAATDAALTNIERVIVSGATAAVTLSLANQTEALTITGSAFGDTITGGAGNDRINATVDAARDVYNGNGGAGDFAYYGAYTTALTVDLTAATAIDATGALYSVVGGSGSTTAASDVIRNFEYFVGGSGADRITASAVRNVLGGGAGADTFIFNTAAKAGGTTGTEATRATTRDTITDFTDASDKLDISKIVHGGSTAWIFDGKVAGFGYADGVGTGGHVHYYTDASGNTVVEGHATDIGGVSFQIQLNGAHTLTAANFLL